MRGNSVCRPLRLLVPAVLLMGGLAECAAVGIQPATSIGRADDLRSDPCSRPNIVLILADDLGWGEVGCFGQDRIPTPTIDRLAARGCRLTCHYAGAAVCAPSRCVLLTGRHAGHAEIRGNLDNGAGGPFPGQWPLTDGAVTIAEVLRDAGYRTGIFGKWGLGRSDSSGAPLRQGFERFYGYICQRNAHSYYPEFLDSDAGTVRINVRPVPGHRKQPDGEVRAEDYRSDHYAPDLILEEALKFIGDHRDEPFFLYLPLIEPHVAMHPPQRLVDLFPREWDEGRDPYRGENGYLPHPRPRAAYAAMIAGLDGHVGRVVARLEELGLTDRTMIVFTSDNGPTHPGSDSRFHAGGAACDFFGSAGGLRGWKGSCYEGGLRVPTIVVWPGVTQPGTELAAPTWFPDWFPTLRTAAAADLPPGIALDGADLGPALRGGAAIPRSGPMIWELADYGGIVAVRKGDWKAVRRDLRKPEPRAWELYNLRDDRAEQRDLAGEHPDIVARLEAAWLANRVAEPRFPNPVYDGMPAEKAD